MHEASSNRAVAIDVISTILMMCHHQGKGPSLDALYEARSRVFATPAATLRAIDCVYCNNTTTGLLCAAGIHEMDLVRTLLFVYKKTGIRVRIILPIMRLLGKDAEAALWYSSRYDEY
jgi:hypothetical protein